MALLPNQSQSRAIAKQENQSNIQIYKDVLGRMFTRAKTPEEFKNLIELTKNVQEIEYDQKSAEIQLQKASLQLIEQVVARVVAVGFGLYFILLQHSSLVGLLFVILGLATPLGHSLTEISKLLDGLKGFTKDSDKLLSNGKEQEKQSQEIRDERP
jgi:hypothetical protein